MRALSRRLLVDIFMHFRDYKMFYVSYRPYLNTFCCLQTIKQPITATRLLNILKVALCGDQKCRRSVSLKSTLSFVYWKKIFCCFRHLNVFQFLSVFNHIYAQTGPMLRNIHTNTICIVYINVCARKLFHRRDKFFSRQTKQAWLFEASLLSAYCSLSPGRHT